MDIYIYITLKIGHIRLIEEPDELVWNYNEGGDFTTKLGYISGLYWDPGVNFNWKAF